MPPTLWRFTFVDSGARPLLIARPQPENGAASDGTRPAFVLDRRTLALLQVQDQSTGAPSLRVDGRTVRGAVRGPQGTRPIDATLSADAYFGPLADLVVESLPLRLGTTYRVPLWELPSASVATHLYTVARREDVTVLGRQWRGAWVVEDHDAETKADRGTLWLVDGPPYVVRWVINLPDGGAVRLDQEAVARD